VFKNLLPNTKYSISFAGVNSKDIRTCVGSFTTFPKAADIERVRLICVSCDRPERLLDNEINMWEKIYKEHVQGGKGEKNSEFMR
jgi:hypothetical protein